MIKTELHGLLKTYSQRYGAYHMQPETMGMFWRKLESLEFTQAREAFDQLLGAHKEPFSWRAVINVIDAMFPPESEQAALDRKWRNNPLTQSDTEKQTELSVLLRGLMDESQARKKRDQKFDWLLEYSHHFIEIWGEVEAEKICRRIMVRGHNDTESRLASLVMDNLRSRRSTNV